MRRPHLEEASSDQVEALEETMMPGAGPSGLGENAECEDSPAGPTAVAGGDLGPANRPPAQQPVVLVLVGIPGSGKSTFCEGLIQGSAVEWVRVNQVGQGALLGGNLQIDWTTVAGR